MSEIKTYELKAGHDLCLLIHANDITNTFPGRNDQSASGILGIYYATDGFIYVQYYGAFKCFNNAITWKEILLANPAKAPGYSM
jgi:hypothetical protein